MFRPTILFVLLSTVTSISIAQSLFFNPPPAQKTVATPKILTPEEFKQQVANLSKQNQQQIKVEASKLIPPPAPLKPIPKPPLTTPPIPADENADKVTSTTTTIETKKTITPSAAAPVPAPTPAPTPPPEETPSTDTQPTPVAPASQSQPYTGFVAPQPAATPTPPTNSSGSQQPNPGWNIKY